MIGYIKGEIKSILDNAIVIVSNNIGFYINIETNNLVLDSEVEIYTHMAVRENDISLWGFLNMHELNLFKLLISVSGVGPKTAQLLIQSIGYEKVVISIREGNYTNLKASGVGPKTAQKIILELKNKANALTLANTNTAENNQIPNSLRDEVTMALASLGYRQSDILLLVNKVMIENPDLNDSQSIIKIILRSI